MNLLPAHLRTVLWRAYSRAMSGDQLDRGVPDLVATLRVLYPRIGAATACKQAEEMRHCSTAQSSPLSPRCSLIPSLSQSEEAMTPLQERLYEEYPKCTREHGWRASGLFLKMFGCEEPLLVVVVKRDQGSSRSAAGRLGSRWSHPHE